MLRYTLRRLAWLPIILLAVSIIAFVMLRALPGQDPAVAIAGQGGQPATDAQIDRVREDLGLNEPITEQYVDWLKGAITLDFGREYNSQKPIREEFVSRFPASFQIVALSLFFSAVFGISFGILSALYRNSGLDYGVRSFAVLGASIPEFFLLALMIIIPSYLWHYSMPVGGYVPLWEDPWHYIRLMMPAALIIGVGGSAGLMRLTRTTMLEVLRSDYVRTAHSKGLRQRTVILTHALRNAGTPIATALGTALIAVFGGSVIVEQVLSIRGLGAWFFQAAFIRDIPVVQFLAVYTAFVVVLVNLAVDLSYAYIDPRIRYS
jgi:peptide/nickel transport system permease protein